MTPTPLPRTASPRTAPPRTASPRTASTRADGITRRCALLGAGGVGAAAVLAACSSGGGTSTSGTATGASGSSGTASGSPTTGAAGSTPAATGSSSGGAPIAALSAVPVGGTAEVQVGGQSVLLSRPEAGSVEGFSPVCPHQGGQVKPNGAGFRCSLHFSEFDIDGAVTKGPSTRDLTRVDVTVSGDQIVQG